MSLLHKLFTLTSVKNDISGCCSSCDNLANELPELTQSSYPLMDARSLFLTNCHGDREDGDMASIWRLPGPHDYRRVVRLGPDKLTVPSDFDHCRSEIPRLPHPSSVKSRTHSFQMKSSCLLILAYQSDKREGRPRFGSIVAKLYNFLKDFFITGNVKRATKVCNPEHTAPTPQEDLELRAGST